MNAIETTALKKMYGPKTAVESLDLAIAEGELFALLGVNGAGKTTMIKMLCCLTKPAAGDARILGDSIRENPEAVKEKINVSPQETAVARNLTVRENLEMIAGIYGFDRNASREKAESMIKAFSLEEVQNAKARTLSGGMQRRVSIAMALISDPKILFLDEPTLGLDVLARRELWSAIRKLKGKITVILTTHYMEEAEALSDRIGVMASGRLVKTGTAAELLAATGTQTLEDAFVALAGGEGANA